MSGGSTALWPRIAWPLAPLAASIAFVLLAGIEMGFAGYRHESGGSNIRS